MPWSIQGGNNSTFNNTEGRQYLQDWLVSLWLTGTVIGIGGEVDCKVGTVYRDYIVE